MELHQEGSVPAACAAGLFGIILTERTIELIFEMNTLERFSVLLYADCLLCFEISSFHEIRAKTGHSISHHVVRV